MPSIGGLPGMLSALWVAFWIFFAAMALFLILRLHLLLNKALPLLDDVRSLVDQLKDGDRDVGTQERTPSRNHVQEDDL